MSFTLETMLITCSMTELGSYTVYAESDQYGPFALCSMDFACSAQLISTSDTGKAIFIIHTANQVRLQYNFILNIYSSQ